MCVSKHRIEYLSTSRAKLTSALLSVAALGAFLPKVAVGKASGAGNNPGSGCSSPAVALPFCLRPLSPFSGFKGVIFCFFNDGCSLGAGGNVSLGLGLASVAAAAEAGDFLQARRLQCIGGTSLTEL